MGVQRCNDLGADAARTWSDGKEIDQTWFGPGKTSFENDVHQFHRHGKEGQGSRGSQRDWARRSQGWPIQSIDRILIASGWSYQRRTHIGRHLLSWWDHVLVLYDRIKNKANVSVKSVLKAVIMDMIRESGDRGTSILNFITNLVLFLGNISMMLERLGMRETEVRKMVWDVLTKGRHANIMAEGDDGIHAFLKAFVQMFGSQAEFGRLWCLGYQEFGFQIEPQGNEGEVRPEDCLQVVTERMEFCSKIVVAVGDFTFTFPKPSKVSCSLSTSFNINATQSRYDACATKAVALMNSCMNQPLMFELCVALYEEHRKEGGHAIGNVLLETFSTRDAFAKHIGETIPNEVRNQKLLLDHYHFLSHGEAAMMMMKALERETSIDIGIARQEELMLGLRNGNRDTITAVRALRN